MLLKFSLKYNKKYTTNFILIKSFLKQSITIVLRRCMQRTPGQEDAQHFNTVSGFQQKEKSISFLGHMLNTNS